MNLLYFKKQLNTFLTNTGISKNALAKTVNISQSQISNWSNYGLKRWTKNSKRLDDYIKKIQPRQPANSSKNRAKFAPYFGKKYRR